MGRPAVGSTAARGRRTRRRRPTSAARIRLFDTGHNRKTDARDAHSIAVVAAALRTYGCCGDGELEAMRMLTDRREALTRRRVQTVGRLQALLAELFPARPAKHHHGSGQGDAGQSPSS